MSKPAEYDPLDCIPSVSVIEQRLKDAERKTRRLRVLLKTAKAIAKEPDGQSVEGDRHA